MLEKKVGNTYTNKEVAEMFKVSSQGGMRRSRKTNSLVLISKHSMDMERNPYEDAWQDDDLFHYTGMGLKGDQDLKYMQNRTLNESETNGVSVYLFESYKANEYIFRGEVYLASEPYQVSELDSEGQMRKVYKFPLALIKDRE